MMRENKKEIHDLTRKCRYQMGKRKQPFRELRAQLSEADQRQNNFDYVQKNLLELEAVHKMMLPSMFDVAHQNQCEQQEAINEATFDFKMESIDPNRLVNKWEAERLNRERKKHAQMKFVD